MTDKELWNVLDIDLDKEDISNLPYSLEQIKLAQAMSEFSECTMFAGWIAGNEYNLWGLIHNRPIKHELLQRIKDLHEQTNSWWVYDDELRCLSTDEWLVYQQSPPNY